MKLCLYYACARDHIPGCKTCASHMDSTLLCVVYGCKNYRNGNRWLCPVCTPKWEAWVKETKNSRLLDFLQANQNAPVPVDTSTHCDVEGCAEAKLPGAKACKEHLGPTFDGCVTEGCDGTPDHLHLETCTPCLKEWEASGLYPVNIERFLEVRKENLAKQRKEDAIKAVEIAAKAAKQRDEEIAKRILHASEEKQKQQQKTFREINDQEKCDYDGCERVAEIGGHCAPCADKNRQLSKELQQGRAARKAAREREAARAVPVTFNIDTKEMSKKLNELVKQEFERRGVKPMATDVKVNVDTKSIKKELILKTLEADATDAAWRLAGKQFLKLAREPIVALLTRNMGKEGDQVFAAKVGAFLDTDLGEALLASLLSTGLSIMPKGGDVPKRLARELRVRAIADAGDVVADVLMGPLRQVAVMYLQGVGKESEAVTLPAGPQALQYKSQSVVNVSESVQSTDHVKVGA